MPVYLLADILPVAFMMGVFIFIVRFAFKWWFQLDSKEDSTIARYTPERTLDDDDW
jgi:hypothetical protein